MKPSLAPFTSGPAACATWAPNGNCVCTAPSRAAVPAVAFRNARRLMRLAGGLVAFVGHCACRPLWLPGSSVRPTKKPQPEDGSSALPRTAALLVGPSLDRDAGVARRHRFALTSIQVSCQLRRRLKFLFKISALRNRHTAVRTEVGCCAACRFFVQCKNMRQPRGRCRARLQAPAISRRRVGAQ